MKRETHGYKGFTLIELMIVIAIVAILVALAVPAYKDFTIRAKVAECVSASSVPKVRLSEYRQTVGSWPTSMGEAGFSTDLSNPVSRYCQYFLYNYFRGGQGDFAIFVDMAEIDSGLASVEMSMIMSPIMETSGMVNWVCTRGWTDSEAIKFIPSSCRGANIYE